MLLKLTHTGRKREEKVYSYLQMKKNLVVNFLHKLIRIPFNLIEMIKINRKTLIGSLRMCKRYENKLSTQNVLVSCCNFQQQKTCSTLRRQGALFFN